MNGHIRFILAALTLAVSIRHIHGVQCVEENGIFYFKQGDTTISRGPFDCMRLKKRTSETVFPTLKSIHNGRALCTLTRDGTPKLRNVYARTAMGTGLKCKYLCKQAHNPYVCNTEVREGECGCRKMGLVVVVVPVVGRGIDALAESCDGKEEGHVFADAVPCSSMQADVYKKRVRMVEGKEGMCVVRKSSESETRYTRTAHADKHLQGCVNICKRGEAVCTGVERGGICECRRKKLRRVLVPMASREVDHRLGQKNCRRSGDCGGCGVCNRKTWMCDLDRSAHERNVCGCGEICPSEDGREMQFRGGKIMCQPNTKKSCMKVPRHLGKMLDNSDPGTRIPNYCREGRVDSADECGCAPTYRRVLGPYSGVYCVKKTKA